MINIDKCIELLNTVKEYESYISGLKTDRTLNRDSFVVEDLRSATSLISGIIYEMETDKDKKFQSILSGEGEIDVSFLKEDLHNWISVTEKDLSTLSVCSYRLDFDFERMMCTVERCSENELLKRLLAVLAEFAQEVPSDFRRLIEVYSDFAHLWGGFDPTEGKYDHFINGIHAVKENIEDIRWLYNTVEDYRSRKVIYGLVRFWLELDFSYKDTLKENNFDDYFDLDILKDRITKDEVFVDCGAYTGDTAMSYIKNYMCYKKMYLYDMLPVNLEKARRELEGNDRIIYRNAGVGNKEQSGKKILVNNSETSTFSIGEKEAVHDPEGKPVESKVEVELVTIDEDIKEKITFLKMDIEGAEINALMGAKDHIINDCPKLAICTYHHYEHLWEIPKLIRSMNPDYRIYLRYNGAFSGIMASEHVVIAVC